MHLDNFFLKLFIEDAGMKGISFFILENLVIFHMLRFQDWMPKDGEIGDHRKLLSIKCVREIEEVGVGGLMMSFTCADDGKFRLNSLIIAPMESATLF